MFVPDKPNQVELEEFQRAELAHSASDHEVEQSSSKPIRYTARVRVTVALTPGEITVPVRFHVPAVDADEIPRSADGTLDVVVRTLRARQQVDEMATGVILIDGTLDLRLGHLCDQKGCVEHFHKSLGDIPGLADTRFRR